MLHWYYRFIVKNYYWSNDFWRQNNIGIYKKGAV